MQSRVPIHQGQGQGLSSYVLGQSAGTESVSLLTSNLPSHNHGLTQANAKAFLDAKPDAPGTSTPNGAFLASSNIYIHGSTSSSVALNKGVIAFGTGAATELAGSNIPHDNIQPYLCVNFIIALQGIFPSRN